MEVTNETSYDSIVLTKYTRGIRGLSFDGEQDTQRKLK